MMAKVWTARLRGTLQGPGEVIAEALSVHGAVVSVTDAGVEVVVSVSAADLGAAGAAALRLVEQAVAAVPAAEFVATALEVRHPDAAPLLERGGPVPELVGYAEIARMAGITRQRAATLTSRADFPPAVAEATSKGPLRLRSDVERFLATWERRVGRPSKAAASTTAEGVR